MATRITPRPKKTITILREGRGEILSGERFGAPESVYFIDRKQSKKGWRTTHFHAPAAGAAAIELADSGAFTSSDVLLAEAERVKSLLKKTLEKPLAALIC
jgi:hypothetical protein